MAEPGADVQREPEIAVPDASDHELIQRLQTGDSNAATELYCRYAHRLRALAQTRCAGDLARCLEADDIVQSVFRSFFRKASSGMYDVPDGDEIWRLLLVIALNKIRDQHDYHTAAKRDVRQRSGSEAFVRLLRQRAKPDETAQVCFQLAIEEAIAPLPAIAQRMIELRLAGHEVAEVAELTGRAKRSVERTLQKFRQTLERTLFEKE